MKKILDYEENSFDPVNKEFNQNLIIYIKELCDQYHHISIYTTNYDEILPNLLGWSDETMSLGGNFFYMTPWHSIH